MQTLSQNRKIAMSAIAVFVASFTFMVIFLGGSDTNLGSMKTDVLHASENTAELVDESTISDDELIFVTDAEGVFIDASDSFCKLVSKSCKLLKGKKLFNYINSEDLADFASVHAKLLQGGARIDGLGPFRFISGSKEKLLILSAKTKEDDNKVVEIIFNAEDLTEQINQLHLNDDEEDKSWVEILYPKIKNIKSDDDPKLLVDKISYHKE